MRTGVKEALTRAGTDDVRTVTARIMQRLEDATAVAAVRKSLHP
jgi:hypothetical protein